MENTTKTNIKGYISQVKSVIVKAMEEDIRGLYAVDKPLKDETLWELIKGINTALANDNYGCDKLLDICAKSDIIEMITAFPDFNVSNIYLLEENVIKKGYTSLIVVRDFASQDYYQIMNFEDLKLWLESHIDLLAKEILRYPHQFKEYGLLYDRYVTETFNDWFVE